MPAVAPEILWAQRSSADEPEKNVVMLTINVPNLPSPPATKFDLTSTGFTFHAKTGDASNNIPDKEYAFELSFFDEIDVDASKTHLNSKCLYAVLRKKTAKDEYWPRLTKDKVRLHNVKTDFERWVDEDEQHESEDLTGALGGGAMGGMDPSMMDPSMMGMGGAGGLDLQSMMAQMGGGMGGMGGMPDFGAEDDDDEADEGDVEDAPSAAAEEAK